MRRLKWPLVQVSRKFKILRVWKILSLLNLLNLSYHVLSKYYAFQAHSSWYFVSRSIMSSTMCTVFILSRSQLCIRRWVIKMHLACTVFLQVVNLLSLGVNYTYWPLKWQLNWMVPNEKQSGFIQMLLLLILSIFSRHFTSPVKSLC